VSAEASGSYPSDHHTTTGHLYLFGTVGELEADVRDFCGDRPAARLRSTGNVVTVATSIATLGIYTPRRVQITCAGEEAP
jgi:hypothetical protein